MRFLAASAAVCILGIIVISLYSAYTISDVLESNAPVQVQFFLGTAVRDVPYCNSQTLDIYIPSEAITRPLPLAVYVHGGGMTSGDKTNINQVFLNALASAGFAIASINYRLAPQYKFPAQIEDVKCAIRYLRSAAHLYGINESKVFAFGTSVGGQLVSIAALTGSRSPFDVGEYLNESSTLTAVVDMFGPANLTSCGCFSTPQKIFSGDQNENFLLASPTHYITPGSPPILIIQGMNDTTVPESQAIMFYNELRAAGDKTQLILVENMEHMFAQVGPNPIAPNLTLLGQDIVNFFQTFRKGEV